MCNYCIIQQWWTFFGLPCEKRLTWICCSVTPTPNKRETIFYRCIYFFLNPIICGAVHFINKHYCPGATYFPAAELFPLTLTSSTQVAGGLCSSTWNISQSVAVDTQGKGNGRFWWFKMLPFFSSMGKFFSPSSSSFSSQAKVIRSVYWNWATADSRAAPFTKT